MHAAGRRSGGGPLRRLLGREAEIIRHLASDAEAVGERVAHRDPFWPAQVTVIVAIALYVSLPDKLTLRPAWLIPVAEGVLLVGLVIAMPKPAMQYSPKRRQFAIALIGLVSLANLVSLFLLVHYLLKGGKAGGHPLILSGVILWVTNVLVFALWFWELDRGGPVTRAMRLKAQVDFLFPQMTDPRWAPEHWSPNFVDYLYVSLTNATAFSPTDTMPLTAKAKILMGVQSLAALATIGLVVARAVNILS
jgi:hypothetical protein